MEGLMSEVTLRSGLIHSISNYWTASISLELCYNSGQGRQGPCSHRAHSLRAEWLIFLEVLLCARKGAEYFPYTLSFDPRHYISRSRKFSLEEETGLARWNDLPICRV